MTQLEEKQYSWSTDEEQFHDQCNSAEEAIAAAIKYHGGTLEAGHTIYVGEVLRVTTASLIDASGIVEAMQEAAYDCSGEASEDYLATVTKEQLSELERAVAAWADSVEPPAFWQVVNAIAHVVTTEDVGADNG